MSRCGVTFDWVVWDRYQVLVLLLRRHLLKCGRQSMELSLALDTGKYNAFITFTNKSGQCFYALHCMSCSNRHLTTTTTTLKNITHEIIVYSRLEVGVMQYLYFSMLTKLNTIKYKTLTTS